MKKILNTLLLFLMVFMLLNPSPVQASGIIRYVTEDGLTGGDCDTWANACTLWYALSVSASGDQIWVKEGTHSPGPAKGDTFTLKNGVAIYGGFTGSEGSLASRDWQNRQTILHGNNNNYHVITASYRDSTTILDGFTIQNGNANRIDPGYDTDRSGGGIYILNGSPTLRNLIIRDNYAQHDGGGMYNKGGSPSLENVIFETNSANPNHPNPGEFSYGYGGGMHNEEGSPSLVDVHFNNNRALRGGAMSNIKNSNPVLHLVEFHNNEATRIGGAMFNNDNSNPIMTYVWFENNQANLNGGAINNDTNSNPVIDKAHFINNKVTEDGQYFGGAIYYKLSEGAPSIKNTIFYKNSAADGGGAIYTIDSTDIQITNASFYGNSSRDSNNYIDGGAIANQDSNITIKNSILWGNLSQTNTVPIRSQLSLISEGTAIVTHSIVQDSWPGTGNLSSDPRFINPDIGDFRLQGSSPAINSGTNTGCPPDDIEGALRPFARICDMGAYEKIGYIPFSWIGGIAIDSNQPIVAVGRPHVGAEVASYIGSTSISTTQYVPMLFKGAFGGGYNAALYIQNVSDNTANLTIEFIDSGGTAVHTRGDTLDPNASKGYWLPAETGLPAGFAGGVKVTSDQSILAVGRPHIDGQVMTYNGMSTGSTTAWLPMFFKNGFGNYNTALYIQNISANIAALTIEYIKLDGSVACTYQDSLNPNASKGYWSLSAPCDSGSLPMGFVGGVKVTSTQNILAVGRAHLGEQITTYNGSSGGAPTAYVPMLFRKAFGGSYNAALYLQNVGSASTDVTIEYVGNNGAVAATQNVTLNAGAIASIWLPGVSGLPDGFVGGARITATQDVITVGRPHLGAEITAYNGTPGGSLNAYLPMLFKNAYGNYQSAFYIQNTSGNTANVDISFYDSSGELSCIKSIDLAAGATEGFWMPTLSCEP